MHLVVLLIPNDFVTEVWEIICFARFFSSRSSAATILVKVGLQIGELFGGFGGQTSHSLFHPDFVSFFCVRWCCHAGASTPSRTANQSSISHPLFLFFFGVIDHVADIGQFRPQGKARIVR